MDSITTEPKSKRCPRCKANLDDSNLVYTVTGGEYWECWACGKGWYQRPKREVQRKQVD